MGAGGCLGEEAGTIFGPPGKVLILCVRTEQGGPERGSRWEPVLLTISTAGRGRAAQVSPRQGLRFLPARMEGLSEQAGLAGGRPLSREMATLQRL